jgi:hypothetical protein
MTSLPLSKEKWMCPNHMTPILDRYLSKKEIFSTNDRVKISHQSSQTEQNIIIQDFTHQQQTKIINNHQLERIDISQIPKTIEEFYSKAKPISEMEINNNTKKEPTEEELSPNEDSFAYDPSIWDILQAILDHIVNDHPYQFSSITESDYPTKTSTKNESNTLDTIDRLLQVLNEPNSTSEQCTIDKINDLDVAIEQNQIS